MFRKRTISAAWVYPDGHTLQGASSQDAAAIEQEEPDEKKECLAHETSNPEV